MPPPKLGQSPLGTPKPLLGEAHKDGFLYGTPASSHYDEFKMPAPVKQPGRKPLKGQKPLF